MPVIKRMCPTCTKTVIQKADGTLRKHNRTPARGDVCDGGVAPMSDPAPTVDETTEEDSVAEKGPWFGAMYDGRCSVSECRIEGGDRIRADGSGGYECEDCGDNEHTVIHLPDPVDGRMAGGGTLVIPKALDFTDPSGGSMSGTEDPLMTPDQFMDPASTEDVKPVLGVNGQPKKVRRDHMKRYAVVLPGETELETYKSSGKPVGRTRATTFNKAATDKKNINDWGKRNVVIGAARRRDLLLQAHGLTHEQDKDRLNAIVVELEEAAGAKVGSDLGTYLHEFTEYMDAGLKTWRDAPEEFQRSLALYAQALADAGLEPIRSLIERTTIIREFGWVCGTFDRIFYHRPSGQYVIGDLKTGKTMDYGKNEVECQLWTYAHGVNQNGIYDWNTDTWGFAQDLERYDPSEWGHAQLQVSETVGVVIHMPVQGPQEGTVELLWADLENGRQHAELCHAVRSQPKGKMAAWGNGPAPVAPPSWEDRFRAVATVEEASRLWGEARGSVAASRLVGLVGLAQQRLRELGVRG